MGISDIDAEIKQNPTLGYLWHSIKQNEKQIEKLQARIKELENK